MISCNAARLDCTALKYFGRKITHREFLHQIQKCAAALTARGVKKGDMVSVCMLTMPEALVLLYAINYVGAVCNFLVLNATEQELHKQLTLTESQLVFTVDIAAEKIKNAAQGTAVTEIVIVSISASMPVMTAAIVWWKSRFARQWGARTRRCWSISAAPQGNQRGYYCPTKRSIRCRSIIRMQGQY